MPGCVHSLSELDLAAPLAKLPDARLASADALAAAVQAASRSAVVSALLDATDGLLLVLNRERQIVAANERASLHAEAGTLVGRRPGDVLSCMNARAPGGCGTTPACAQCGTLAAVLACHERARPAEAECLLRTELDASASRELNVRATPIVVEGHHLTVISLRDISAEKRRDALEQIFLHDVLNTVAGLRGWVSRLTGGRGDPARATERVERLSLQLEREIRDHRALVEAERGTLVPGCERVRAADVLAEVELVLSSHASARDRHLEVAPAPPGTALRTDLALARRVIVNMGTNALEATPAGGTVRIGCDAGANAVRFRVANPGVIPPEVQTRIFQRSFSTKARRGRGLGTWSMKILGERTLGGDVSFTSSEVDGTVFTFALPRAS